MGIFFPIFLDSLCVCYCWIFKKKLGTGKMFFISFCCVELEILEELIQVSLSLAFYANFSSVFPPCKHYWDGGPMPWLTVLLLLALTDCQQGQHCNMFNLKEWTWKEVLYLPSQFGLPYIMVSFNIRQPSKKPLLCSYGLTPSPLLQSYQCSTALTLWFPSHPERGFWAIHSEQLTSPHTH